jgi:hypothetical protein
MKNSTIKVTEIPALIRQDIRLLDVSENQLDVEQNDYWTRETENTYNKVTAKLDKISAKGKGYEIYVWYDVSGFDYWVIKQEEENYAQITIKFDNDFINKSQLNALVTKIERVVSKVNDIIFN